MSDKFSSGTLIPKQSNKHHVMSYFFQSEFNEDIGRSICMTKIIFFTKLTALNGMSGQGYFNYLVLVDQKPLTSEDVTNLFVKAEG